MCWRCPKYAGFRASLFGDAPALLPRIFPILPLWGRFSEGAERATRRRLRFLLFQMGFDFSPALFLSFLLSPQIFSQRARGFWGAPNPAWIGRLRVIASGTLINKGLANRLPGDALFTRGFRASTLKCPKYAGFRAHIFETPKI